MVVMGLPIYILRGPTVCGKMLMLPSLMSIYKAYLLLRRVLPEAIAGRHTSVYGR
jgi:hypothetical protein